jgi:ribonuclease HI
MINSVPQYVLFCESNHQAMQSGLAETGNWSFTLKSMLDGSRFEITSDEPEETGVRLDLLAVIRGLEALDQCSRVTLFTASRYVTHGLRFGLPQWRERDWQWEEHGRRSAVANVDLWRRVDRAMAYHQVDCKRWRIDRLPGPSKRTIVPRPHMLRKKPARTRLQWRPSVGLAGFLDQTTPSSSLCRAE